VHSKERKRRREKAFRELLDTAEGPSSPRRRTSPPRHRRNDPKHRRHGENDAGRSSSPRRKGLKALGSTTNLSRLSSAPLLVQLPHAASIYGTSDAPWLETTASFRDPLPTLPVSNPSSLPSSSRKTLNDCIIKLDVVLKSDHIMISTSPEQAEAPEEKEAPELWHPLATSSTPQQPQDPMPAPYSSPSACTDNQQGLLATFLDSALVYFARSGRSPRPAWRKPRRQLLPPSASFAHGFSALLCGCGWDDGVQGAPPYVKRGIIFVGPEGDAWRKYVMEHVRVRAAHPRITETRAVPILVVDERLLACSSMDDTDVDTQMFVYQTLHLGNGASAQ
jgi:hypothetical protein